MTVEIEGVTLHLAHPDEVAVQWVGQDELMRQLLAAWMVVNEQDLPMNPRLLGKPGVGKTTLAHAAGKRYTVRDGINVGRFAIKLKRLATRRTGETEALEIAIVQVLGEEALRYVRRNRPSAS